MNTLFDFVTHTKGLEYMIALTSIAAYLLFWEFLKAKPFTTLLQVGKADIGHLKMVGASRVFQSVKRVIAAPFIGLAYVAVLPFAFLFALVITAVSGILGLTGREISFGWRPMEAYLSGKKKEKKESEKSKEQQKKA